ncbi:MAG: LptF/LptG family permease [Puniceicoccales bacterium]|jgi:LPS export ABC transporter permease LptG|nr:LptF/LptG family permease [Puniceicoccales bacterium]
MFRTSDRYIFTEWLRYFSLCLSLSLGILLLEDMYNHLHTLLQQGVPFLKIGYYYFLLCPQLSHLAIPVAFFLSLLLALGQLRQHNEIAAFQTSGISLLGITRSLALVSVMLSSLLTYFQCHLIPHTQQIFQEYQRQLAHSSEDPQPRKVLYHVGWNDVQQHRLWYMRELEPSQGIAIAVNLHEKDADGHEKRRISAARAFFNAETKRWTFYQGQMVTFDTQTYYPVSSILFECYDVEDLWSSPQLFALHHKKPEELTFKELRTVLRHQREVQVEGILAEGSALKSHRILYWSYLFSPWSCCVLFMIALPCAAVGIRTDSMASIAKAAGFLFLFYLLSHGCRALGLCGFLTPPLAAVCPYLLLALCVIPSYRLHI